MNINIRKEMKNSKIGGEMINQMKNKKEKWEDEKREDEKDMDEKSKDEKR